MYRICLDGIEQVQLESEEHAFRYLERLKEDYSAGRITFSRPDDDNDDYAAEFLPENYR